MPLSHFTVDQNYEKMVELTDGYGVQLKDPEKVLPALEKAVDAVMVDKRQALLNVHVSDPA